MHETGERGEASLLPPPSPPKKKWHVWSCPLLPSSLSKSCSVQRHKARCKIRQVVTKTQKCKKQNVMASPPPPLLVFLSKGVPKFHKVDGGGSGAAINDDR